MGTKRVWMKDQVPLKRDWRIGLEATPVLRTHYLFHEVGVVEQVFPTGHMGINCRNGVLQIRMITEGLILFDAADNWKTC
jgi:hypothetical protein